MMETFLEKTIIGKDLTAFWFQVGFVEGIIEDRKKFKHIEQAFRHIFRNNREFAVFLWNGIPVKLSYQQDLPSMIEDIISLLQFINKPNSLNRKMIRFKTSNLETLWSIELEGEDIVIYSKWRQVEGNYEAALNLLNLIKMPILTFLFEWKLLLTQLHTAFLQSGASWKSVSTKLKLQELIDIEATIEKRGRFYRYEERIF